MHWSVLGQLRLNLQTEDVPLISTQIVCLKMETLYSDIDNQCHLFATLMWTPTHFYVHISFLYIFLRCKLASQSIVSIVTSYQAQVQSTHVMRLETEQSKRDVL